MTYIIGFDSDEDCSSVAADAAAAGVSFIARYLKNLTLSEVHTLGANNIQLVSIYESTARRALLGAAYGNFDGQSSVVAMQKLGQPVGSAIYTTVDFDPEESQAATVLDYITAFAKVARAYQYKIGVYANGELCQKALDAGLVDFTWLAGGMGMSGSLDFARSGRATMIQGVNDGFSSHWQPEGGWTPLGLSDDPDFLDADVALVPEFGGWILQAAA